MKHFYWAELNRELRRTVGAASSADELTDDELSLALANGRRRAYAEVLDKWARTRPVITHAYLARRGLERSRAIWQQYRDDQTRSALNLADAQATATTRNSEGGRKSPKRLSTCFSAAFRRDFRRYSDHKLTAVHLDMLIDDRFPCSELGDALVSTIVRMILLSPIAVQRELTRLADGRTPDGTTHISVHKLKVGVLSYLRSAESLPAGEQARIRAFLDT